jgi:2-dehydropantoate 2-reductase
MKRTGIACRLPDAGLEISGGWRRTFFGGLEYSYLSGAVARKSAGLCCAKRLGVRMRVLVIGAGVLGSLYAGRLAAAGNEVTLLARGSRLAELQREPLRLVNDADGTSTLATLAVVPKLEPTDAYDMGLVMVRADQVKDLLPQLSTNSGVKFFLFMHNRAAGSSALARAVGPGRLLLGFPGAGGHREGNTVRYRDIAEQPTTVGEPDGSLSQRLWSLAKLLAEAGFKVALSRRMDDWLKTHAVFVTAIAGAIYRAEGSATVLARRRDCVRALVRGIRQGFSALSAAGVVIEPRKLALLFALPAVIPESYWRRYLAHPAAELIFAGHAQAARDEMWAVVEELREIVTPDPRTHAELETLWAAVETAASRKHSLRHSER